MRGKGFRRDCENKSTYNIGEVFFDIHLCVCFVHAGMRTCDNAKTSIADDIGIFVCIFVTAFSEMHTIEIYSGKVKQVKQASQSSKGQVIRGRNERTGK